MIGFAIRKAFAEFRRVALKDGLADPRNIAHSIRFSNLANLVLCHLNRICSLLPGEGMTTQWIHSREGIVVIELETNYNRWIPEQKLDEVVSVIKEHFNLPKDAKPGWYLENDIDQKPPDQYFLPSKPSVSCGDATKFLTVPLSVNF